MTTDGVSINSKAEILIVEDDSSSLKMLSDLLKKAGYKVRPATDGELGLRSIQAKLPELILLDFKLPGMNGVEVCRRLKADPRTSDIPVIFISALAESELKVEALAAGAVDYVTKPLDSSEVLARMKTHLSMYRLHLSHAAQAEELKVHRAHLETLVNDRTAELLASEERYRRVVEGTGDLVTEVDAEGRFTYINHVGKDVLGIDTGEGVGQIAFDFIHPEDRQKTQDWFREFIDGQLQNSAVENRQVNRETGAVTNVVWTASFEYDHGGQINVVHGIGHDITKRKQAEEERDRVLNLSTDLICVASPDGHFKYLNPAWEKLIGYPTEELLARPFLDFIHPDDHQKNTLEVVNLERGNETSNFENRYICKDGSQRTISWRATFLSDTKVMYCIGRDITESKRVEEDRKATIRLLEVLNTQVDMRELMKKVLHFMHELSGCEAVGIRIREGDDYPYYTTSGFSDGFLEAERYLCTRDLDGQIIRDDLGHPIVECMCGNILCGRFDPSLEFFTTRGSFISNCTTNLLAKTTEDDRQATTRNRCNSEGYESVFLVPLRCGGETFGLLQFNDSRMGCFSPEFVDQAERLADNLATTLSQRHGQEQITASLKEKEVLLREIHHRVKNNMQVIVSLLRMHARHSGSTKVRNVFDDCRVRVSAMSLIHEALYLSDDMARIDSGSYLTKLCRNLSQAHGAVNRGIAVVVGKDNVTLGMDQGVSVGMIVCELVSNSFKHAFPKGKPGSIQVSLSNIDGEKTELIVQDDGVGLPPGIDLGNPPSLGLELATITVTHELAGAIEVERDGGTKFSIQFHRKVI